MERQILSLIPVLFAIVVVALIVLDVGIKTSAYFLSLRRKKIPRWIQLYRKASRTGK